MVFSLSCLNDQGTHNPLVRYEYLASNQMVVAGGSRTPGHGKTLGRKEQCRTDAKSSTERINVLFGELPVALVQDF